MSTFVSFDALRFPLEKGTTLIEASAGTGKTHSIATLYLRLVLEERVPVSEILALTFTNAAAKELRERIRARLRGAVECLKTGDEAEPLISHYRAAHSDVQPGLQALSLALQTFDEARIFTIHSFCQRLLREHFFESGAGNGVNEGAELLPSSTPLFEEVMADFWRIRFQNAPPLLAALALFRGESPGDWVRLLEQTTNHPNLRLQPGPSAKLCDELARELLAAYELVHVDWVRGQGDLQSTLEADKTLKPKGRAERLALLPRLCECFENPPDVELLELLEKFLPDAVAEDTGKNKSPLPHPFFNRCEALFTSADVFFNQLTHEALAYAAAELPVRKRRRGVMTYDDLIIQVHAALRRSDRLAESVGRHYQVALIDEFQDTDPLQCSIFERLFGGQTPAPHWLFLVGDPKQAIYGFRGADIFTYLQAALSAARRATLEVNWRSSERLLQGFNALFSRQNAPFLFDEIQYHPVHSPGRELQPEDPPALEFRLLPRPTAQNDASEIRGSSDGDEQKKWSQDAALLHIAEAVASDLHRLHDQKNAPLWKESAVIVRTHSQAEAVRAALARRGIRSVLHTEKNVFHSPQATEWARILEAVLTPARSRRLQSALATSFFGLNGNQLAGLIQETRQAWIDRFVAFRARWNADGFMPMARQLVSECGVPSHVLGSPEGERKLTDLLHLTELLHAAETENGFTPEALLEWFARQRQAERPASPEAAQLRLESDGNAVQIVTIHKSKGLEYSLVLCPFLWIPGDTPKRQRVQFHDAQGCLVADLRGKKKADAADLAAHQKEALAEEMRLLYVALTRARRHCLVYMAETAQAHLSALAHLVGGDLRLGAEKLAAENPAFIALHRIETEFQSGESELDKPAQLGLLPMQCEQAPSCGEESLMPHDHSFRARQFPDSIRLPSFLTSFTGLSAGTSREEPEWAQPSKEPSELSEKPDSHSSSSPQDQVDAGIFQFERGVRAGEFFHDVLQHLDFQKPEALDYLVPTKLTAYGLSASPHAAAVMAKLKELLETELAPGLRLNKITAKNRLAEVDFSARLPHLSAEDLKSVFAEEPVSSLFHGAGDVRFSRVSGFLRGFVDLFFQHDGRYYLLDWKSNWLGNRPEDYDLPKLEETMRAHYYNLQAALYFLAADRFLAARLVGYDYEKHFGGIFYLFLRGIEKGNSQRGICRLRPSLALVKRLRRLIGEGV